MMQAQTYTHARTQPRRRDIFFHAGKTLKLIGGLMMDRRVPVWRKLLFVGSIVALLALLFFPDLFSEAFLSVVLPLVGTVAGVPVDAGIDWMAFSLLAVNLLKFFPAEMVGEYYTNIFGR
ncbi:MAG: hypothetical protein ACR2H5_17015 [Ktedonobacteraceae bacterium]